MAEIDEKHRYEAFGKLLECCHDMGSGQKHDVRRNVQNLLCDQNFEYKNELAVVWLNHPKTNNARKKGIRRNVTARFKNTQLAVGIIKNLNVEKLSETFCEKLVNIACSDSSYKEAMQRKILDILKNDPPSNQDLAPIQSKLAEAWEKQTIEKPSEIESEITNLASNHTYDPGNKGPAP